MTTLQMDNYDDKENFTSFAPRKKYKPYIYLYVSINYFIYTTF